MLLGRPTLALAAAVLIATTAAAPAADVKLVETIWTTKSADCPIRQIKFYDFNRAVVYADKIGSDNATWNLDPPVLHIYFDNWDANLDGQILGGNDFEALYTWRDAESLKASTVRCDYHPQ